MNHSPLISRSVNDEESAQTSNVYATIPQFDDAGNINDTLRQLIEEYTNLSSGDDVAFNLPEDPSFEQIIMPEIGSVFNDLDERETASVALTEADMNQILATTN